MSVKGCVTTTFDLSQALHSNSPSTFPRSLWVGLRLKFKFPCVDSEREGKHGEQNPAVADGVGDSDTCERDAWRTGRWVQFLHNLVNKRAAPFISLDRSFFDYKVKQMIPVSLLDDRTNVLKWVLKGAIHLGGKKFHGCQSWKGMPRTHSDQADPCCVLR